MSSIAVATVPSPRIVFIAHRWGVAVAAGRTRRPSFGRMAGGQGTLSLASDAPSRALFGAQVRLQARILDERSEWTILACLTTPGTVEIEPRRRCCACPSILGAAT